MSKFKFDYKAEAKKFLEQYPSYIKQVISYEEAEGYSIKFTLKSGMTFWYYPLLEETAQYGSKNK